MTTGIKNWSTTAGNNNSASPNGAPEGMPPGGVNNTIRQNMAEIRAWYEDYAWVDFGHTGILYIDGTNFRVNGNQTSVYHVNRRIRAYGTTMGTLYGTITASSYLTNTTVTVLWDSGVLTSNLSEISVGIAVNTQALSMQCIKGFSDAAAARTTLGLGTASTTDSSAYATAAQGAKADTALQSLPVATNAESDAGLLSTVSLVPSNFAQNSLASSGYQKFPGGLIVQWGKSGNISANSSAGVTFPIPFPNAVFSVTCTNDRAQDNQGSIAVLSISLSSFSIGNSHDSTNAAYWVAWGK